MRGGSGNWRWEGSRGEDGDGTVGGIETGGLQGNRRWSDLRWGENDAVVPMVQYVDPRTLCDAVEVSLWRVKIASSPSGLRSTCLSRCVRCGSSGPKGQRLIY